MKQININIYTYDELSEQAKDKAFSNWDGYYFWDSDNRKALKAFCEHYDIKCKNWEYDSYYYRFDIDVDYEETEQLTGKRLYSYINDLTYQIKPFKLYYKGGISGNTKFHYSKIFKEDTINLTGYCADHAFYLPIKAYLEKPDYKKTYKDLMEECVASYFEYCRDDHKHCTSQEYFAEECEANEWQFFVTGEMCNELELAS